MTEAFILSAVNTPFGRLEGCSAQDLMAQAANEAIAQSGVQRAEIDAVLCGYATTMPHLMLATLMSEKLGLQPDYAHGLQAGGASGAAMLMLAKILVNSGRYKNVLVMAGENRLTGQSVDASLQTLAQVGDIDAEVPLGASIPAYYALLASEYMHAAGVSSEDLAHFAVLMRKHACGHPDAHFQKPISVDDVLASRVIASPLHLFDCCPMSDGGTAFVVSQSPGPVRISGAGQAHRHQHVSALESVFSTGADAASQQAFAEAGLGIEEIDYLAIYDSFTITLVMLLEEIGFAPRGKAIKHLQAGQYEIDGPTPLNTHGGLLSFGHSGVAGGLAHVVEAFKQLTGQAANRQTPTPRKAAFAHADGGVLSAHVSLILQKE